MCFNRVIDRTSTGYSTGEQHEQKYGSLAAYTTNYSITLVFLRTYRAQSIYRKQNSAKLLSSEYSIPFWHAY